MELTSLRKSAAWGILLLVFVRAASAEPQSVEKKALQLHTLAFTPKLHGHELTVTVKVEAVQHVAGDREGEFPSLLIHHTKMSPSDRVTIYAQGELADALHRMDRAHNDRLKGRTITATGVVVAREVVDENGGNQPHYELQLRDWKKFQVIRDE